jgi:hypothetical protein
MENRMSRPSALVRSRRLAPAFRPAIAAAIAASSLAAGAAWADPSPALDRMSFSAGAFYADPSINVNGDTRYGHLDSGDVGTRHVTLPRVKANLLIGDSQGLDFDYYRYDKSYNPTVSGSTNVGGTPISGSATIDGNLRLDLAQLAYKWWIGSGNDVFGIGAGAAYYHARIEASAQATVAGFSGSASGSTSDATFAPLLEAGWRHAFNQNLRMYAEASGIKKNGGNINGHIYGGALGVEWFPLKNVGLVADYSISKIDLHRDNSDALNLDIRLKGPSAYVKVRF